MRRLLGYGSLGGEAEDLLRELSVGAQEEILGQQQEEILGADPYGVLGLSSAEDDIGHTEAILGALPASPARNAALLKARAARTKLASQRAAGVGTALALPTSATKVDVIPQVNRRHRLMVCGLGLTVVPIGTGATITIQPQRLFKPKVLSIPSSIALYFSITSVQVGQDSQLANAQAIPAECFTELAVNSPIDWDTCNIGNTITIQINNIEPAGGAASRTFMGMLVGLGVKP